MMSLSLIVSLPIKGSIEPFKDSNKLLRDNFKAPDDDIPLLSKTFIYVSKASFAKIENPLDRMMKKKGI